MPLRLGEGKDPLCLGAGLHRGLERVWNLA